MSAIFTQVLLSSMAIAPSLSAEVRTTNKLDVQKVCLAATDQLEGEHYCGGKFDAYCFSQSSSLDDLAEGVREQFFEAMDHLKVEWRASSPESYFRRVLKTGKGGSPRRTFSGPGIIEPAYWLPWITHSLTLTQLKALAPVFCAAGENPHGCASAFSSIVDVQSPANQESGYISFPKALADIQTNKDYIQASARFALKILAKFRQARAGRPVSGDFFEDLVASFKESIQPDAKAEALAWNYLGIMASRGASATVFYDLATTQSYSVFTSMALASSIVVYLDRISLNTGKMYSIPPSITTHCNYTKAYHFWDAAFLTRELMRQNHSPQAILASIHHMGVTYEQFAKYGANFISKEVVLDTKTRLNNLYVFEKRKDILFNDAGAMWALRRDSAVLNLDHEMQSMYSGSSMTPKLPASAQSKEWSQALIHQGLSQSQVYAWRSKIGSEAYLKRWLETLK